MKKLKGYVWNKAKPEGSIAEGYVVEEALTFSSHYFRDVTTKFNHLDRNVDPPPPTCQFQVFQSVCKSIGLWSVIQFDAQELKKVKWYVLHNSPEIDTYRSQFKSLFPNKDMKEEFTDWFWSQIHQHHIDNDKDPEVSTTNELFSLACGPTWTPISINSCIVNGVRYVVHSCDERRITQNSGICSLGPDGEMYYGRKVRRLVLRNNMTQIDTRVESFKDDQYILVTQVKQVFYLEDKAKPYCRVVEHVNHKKFSDEGVIVVEDDPDIIHFDNSSDLPLSTSLNDLDNATMHIDVDVTHSHDDDSGGKGKRKPNLDGKTVGRLNTHDKTRNRSLKEITDTKGPVPIQFELRDKQTVMPLGDHMTHWSSYIGEIIRGKPLYYLSWLKVLKERKAVLITDIRAHHWVIDPTTGTYNVEKIRRARLENITASEWDKYIEFWNDPRNISRVAQNRGRPQPLRNTRRSLTPSSWQTLLTRNSFGMRTDEEIRRLEATGTYTDDEINRLARGDIFLQFESGGASGSGRCGDEEEGADHQDDEDEDSDGNT
nr:hypothetical protein [Tanacetum cinerariifolium]